MTTRGAWAVTWFDAEGLTHARPRWEATPPPEIQHLTTVGKEASDNVAIASTTSGALVAAAPFGPQRDQLGVFLFAPTDSSQPSVKAVGVTHYAKQARRPAVAADATGYYLAWHEEDGSIHASRFDANGKEGDAHVLAPEGPKRERVALAVTNGGALALWAEGETLIARGLDASAKPAGPAWVVGKGGLAYSLTGATWSPSTTSVSDDLSAVCGTASSGVWAVGTDASGTNGRVINWNGISWSVLSSMGLTGNPLYAIACANGQAYAVGKNMVMLGCTSASCTPMNNSDFPALVGKTAYAIWITPSSGAGNDIWVAGKAGVLFHYDGTRWTQVPTGTAEPTSSPALLGMPTGQANNFWAPWIVRRNPMTTRNKLMTAGDCAVSRVSS